MMARFGMKDSAFTKAILAVGASAILAAGAQAQNRGANSQAGIYQSEERVIRVYNLHDLVDSMQGVYSSARSQDRGTRFADTVTRLAILAGMETQPLSDGVFAISGFTSSHKQFEETIETLRAQNAGRYEVSYLFLDASIAENVDFTIESTGADARELIGLPGMRVLQSIGQLGSESFELLVMESYVEQWMPVVSDSAVGYQSNISEATSGVMATTTIVKAADDTVVIEVEGQMLDSEIEQREVNLSGSSLVIGLPTVTRQSFGATKRVEYGVPTVVAVIDGMGPSDEQTLVIATVRKSD